MPEIFSPKNVFTHKKENLSHFFCQPKYLVPKKEGKERKIGNIGQIRSIGNEVKTGMVRKVPNSFKLPQIG